MVDRDQDCQKRVGEQCPDVKWLSSYAVLGPRDYLDIFTSDNAEAAARVSTCSSKHKVTTGTDALAGLMTELYELLETRGVDALREFPEWDRALPALSLSWRGLGGGPTSSTCGAQERCATYFAQFRAWVRSWQSACTRRFKSKRLSSLRRPFGSDHLLP